MLELLTTSDSGIIFSPAEWVDFENTEATARSCIVRQWVVVRVPEYGRLSQTTFVGQ